MITLISCGIQKSDITKYAYELIEKSDIVIGGKRLLEFITFCNVEKVLLNTELIKSLDVFLNKNKDKNIAFLASGDSLFHGIGSKLSSIVKNENLTIIPNVTAMQAFFAKIKQPWHEVSFYSIHGKEKILPYINILSDKISVIYCDDQMSAAQVAEKLVILYPYSASRDAVIAENLGCKNERIIKGTLHTLKSKKITGLSILTILSNNSDFVDDPGIPVGIADIEFNKSSNCITHSEVRAIIISKLKLGHGVIWDLGAGSGSVGIEAALLSSTSEVYSIEKNEKRVAKIEENRQKFGVNNLNIINGLILNEINKCPSPRSVFIGGGGSDISEIIKKSYERLLPGGRIVATSVLLETYSALINTLKESCTEILSVSINRTVPLAGKKLLKSDNTITIFIYEKPYEK
jgi:precorrin-6B C5,15-methyltransferase / cobalt-precorrin-6B C5,C15-methyltransferase